MVSRGFVYHQARFGAAHCCRSMKMRVIAGTYRSRQLNAPRGLATRPTSDRLRETLFNVLASQVGDAVFADLYAGSGAVGIEALSRGARWVYFVEQAPAAVTAIRENLTALNIQSGFKIHASSVAASLRRMSVASAPAPLHYRVYGSSLRGRERLRPHLDQPGRKRRFPAYPGSHRRRRTQPATATRRLVCTPATVPDCRTRRGPF